MTAEREPARPPEQVPEASPSPVADPARGTREHPVVLLLDATSRPKTALLRAAAFSRRLSVPLVVVGLVPDDSRCNMIFPERNLAQVEAGLARDGLAARRLWRWCNRTLVMQLPPERVQLRQDGLLHAASAVAGELAPQLLVIPDSEIGAGSLVTAIVEDTGVSVLVSRAAQPTSAIIAATDLTLVSVPVLREGLAVGEALAAPVTFVHNVKPAREFVTLHGADQETLLQLAFDDQTEREQRGLQRLQLAAEALDRTAATTVVSHVDTVAAILHVARRQDADLVIVGHHRRSWVGRVFGETVAAGVVARAVRSVLVVPLPGQTRRRSSSSEGSAR